MRAWLVIALLLAVLASPLFTQPEFEDVEANVNYSIPLQTTVSPSTGWTSGGEEIIITGSGFLDLADRNVTDDGQTHQWAQTTADSAMKPVDGMPWPWIRTAMSTWFTSRTRVTSSGTASMTGRVGAHRESKIAGRPTAGTSTWSSTATMSFTCAYDLHQLARDAGIHTLRRHHVTSTEVTLSALFGPVGIAVDSNNHPHISYAANGQYCGNGLRLLRMTAPAGPAKGSMWKQPGLRIVHPHRRERPRLHRLSGPQRIETEDRHGQERAMGRLHRQYREPSKRHLPWLHDINGHGRTRPVSHRPF